MPDPENLPLQTAIKYNPHLWSEEELRAVFVARGRELERILERIRATGPDKVPQHLLITGYRGMGKTTLLRRIALAVADAPDLDPQWIALTFPEEQYTVSTLAELWMNVLDSLADTLEREGAPPDALARLDSDVQTLLALDIDKREAAALELLQSWVAEHRRRILLLIDSSDLLFSALGHTAVKGVKGSKSGGDSDAGATPLWRLRKTLSHFPGILWLGASYQALEIDHQYSDAFHDFFEIVELRPLSLEEMRNAMLALARTFGAGRGLRGEAAEREMRRGLDARPERLKSLRALTGGNPRTTVILYELFAAGWQSDVHSDLKALLDLMTPLYKARMEHLAEQPRKLLAHLMEHWAPIGAGDLAQASGVPATTVSGQLTRLEAEGLVEKTRLAGTRRSGYQVSERFFNVWYLMRYTPRRVRQRLTWLVEFMRLWFSADDLQRLARRNMASLRDDGQRAEQLEYALALADALPDHCEEHHALEWSVFSAARRMAEQSRKNLREVLPALFDGSQPQQPLVTADDYLRRFRALDAKLADCPHARDGELRGWIEAVKGSLSLGLAEKERIAEAAAGLKMGQFEGLGQVFVDEAEKWREQVAGGEYPKVQATVLSGDFFPDCPDAKLAYQQIITEFSSAPWALLFAVNLMAHRHHDEWTEKLYRKAIELDPKNAWPWNNLGNLLKNRLDRFQEAEAAYRKAIELDPKYALPWIGLGNLLQEHLDRFQEAEAAYRKAIELDPKDAWPWNNLGNLLKNHLDRFQEAEAAYRKAIELDPKYALPWIGLGNLLQEHLDRFQEAEAAYRKAIELDPKNAWPWNNLGNLLKNHLDRFQEAEAAYRKAIELDPKDADPWIGLGILLQDHLGRYQEAEAAYRKAIELDPKYAWPWNNLGRLLKNHLDRYQEAEAAYRKAIELDPKNAWPWNNLGNLLQEHLDRFQEAEAAYRKAIELDPKNASPWIGLGNLLQEHLDRFQEAEAAYRQAMALDPQDPYPQANLARLLAVRGAKGDTDGLYRQAAGLAAELAGEGAGIGYVEVVLQAQLWLKNLDAAGLALDRLARAAAEGNGLALFKIQEQARECHAIGRGPMLADLMDASEYADLLRPIGLALRAAHSGSKAFDGIPAEIRGMAEESLANIQRGG